MAERQLDTLRLQPQMLPAVRAEFRAAVDQLSVALMSLKRDGPLLSPWLGDEASGEVAAHYTARALEAPDSSYAALIAYRDELTRIHDALQQMEDHYRRTEGENAARWGLRA